MESKFKLPDKESLSKLLSETWDVHSEFQENYLEGMRDEMWAGWYAGYLLGRLGNFTTPSTLARLLQETESLKPWADKAAEHLLANLG
ncbi:MAG TPA: hypothetical protein VMN57_11125 [Anaerolineales bacterium]|nr:hypothetical protein [Anaerolineales bacterium]